MSLAREEMVLGFGVFGLLGEGVDSVYFECWNQVFLYHMNLVNKNVFLGDDEEVCCATVPQDVTIICCNA